MSDKNTGGPAFPSQSGWDHQGNWVYGNSVDEGMSLRDYLAAKAMQAQVCNPLRLGDDEAHRLIAERAYRMADAMLEARKK